MGGRVVDWLIYAAILGAVALGIRQSWLHYVIAPAEARGAAAQLAKDQPVIADWKTRAEKAEGANRDLSGQVDQLRRSFDQLLANASGRIKDSEAARARAEAQAKDAKQTLANEYSIIERVKSGELCVGICQRAYDQLGKLIAGSTAP